MGAAIHHKQPVLPHIDKQCLDRFGNLRQFDARFSNAGFASELVFFLGQLQHMQLRAGGTHHQQGIVVHAEVDVLQRPTLGIHLQRRFTVGVLQLRGDGFLAVRITGLVGVAQHQRLTIGQAQHHHGTARLPLLQRHHLGAGR